MSGAILTAAVARPSRFDTREAGSRAVWLSITLSYAASIGLVAAATVAASLSTDLAAPSSLTLFFLIVVVLSAYRFGLGPAVLTSILSVLCWDYFFTRPYFSLRMGDQRDVFALIAFLTISFVIGGMLARIRSQNARLGALTKSLSESYALSRSLSQLATMEGLASFVVIETSRLVNAPAIVVLTPSASEEAPSIFPNGRELDQTELAAANMLLCDETRLQREASAGRFRFRALDGAEVRIGVVAVPQSLVIEPSSNKQFESFLGQAAIALERAKLGAELEGAKAAAETERIRNALLTSVSHDLRTPLTSVIGALSTLEAMGPVLNQSQCELIAHARREAERLNRFVGNLLDITRLEAGGMAAPLTAVDLADVIASAVERAQPLLNGHRIDLHLPMELPDVRADFALLHQVVFNVLDNAAKYSPAATTISIRAEISPAHVTIAISDEGCGIPEQDLERIFEKFHRAAQGDAVPPGTGLGLMICRGFLALMGGTIKASNRPGGLGSIFSIALIRDADRA